MSLPEYVLANGLETTADAEQELWSLLTNTLATNESFPRRWQQNLEMLEHSWIPSEDGDTNDFLSLHWDRGHPIFPTRPETIILFVGLYFPMGNVAGNSLTRIVPLNPLLSGNVFGTMDDIEKRLRSYALLFGSSWDCDKDSGNRVSCFGRILDALSDKPQLTNFRITPKNDWYMASNAGHEFNSLAQEREFYFSAGLEIEKSEIRVNLQPGDLLVVNNLNALHGRIGLRRASEIRHFLIGISNAVPDEVSTIRNWLISQLSGM